MRTLIGLLMFLLAGALVGCVGSIVTDDDDAVDDDTADDDTGDDDDDDDDDDNDDDTDDDDDDDTADDDTGDDDTYDCDNLPAGWFNYTPMIGGKATEDMALDDQGMMIGAVNGALFKSDYAGTATIWVPGQNSFIAGLRALPSGDFVYSDVSANSLVKVDAATGDKSTLLSGLSYGNGLEVDLFGNVYVAEQNSGMVRRVDGVTGEFEVMATGLNNPNGLTFSPDYSRLYVGSFGGGMIYVIDVDANMDPVNVDTHVPQVGTGYLDGMGVDICGNIYICDYGQIKIFRISPDGMTVEPVIDLSPDSYWIPNMQWGSGVGGWDPLKLYVLDIDPTRMYEVDLGVPAKQYAYP